MKLTGERSLMCPCVLTVTQTQIDDELEPEVECTEARANPETTLGAAVKTRHSGESQPGESESQ